VTPPATSTRKIGIPANGQPNVPGMLSRNASSYQECLENASPYLNSFSGERKSYTSVNIIHHSADRGWTQESDSEERTYAPQKWNCKMNIMLVISDAS